MGSISICALMTFSWLFHLQWVVCHFKQLLLKSFDFSNFLWLSKSLQMMSNLIFWVLSDLPPSFLLLLPLPSLLSPTTPFPHETLSLIEGNIAFVVYNSFHFLDTIVIRIEWYKIQNEVARQLCFQEIWFSYKFISFMLMQNWVPKLSIFKWCKIK